jgi:hypothetical protein
MNEMNSVTGLFPRKVNISFKKRNINSVIEKIGIEIKSELANYFEFEKRIKIILEIQAKYSSNAEVMIGELIDLCHNFILDEIEAIQPEKESKNIKVVPGEAIVKKNQLWVKYFIKDSSNEWWSRWEKVPYWGYENDFEENSLEYKFSNC